MQQQRRSLAFGLLLLALLLLAACGGSSASPTTISGDATNTPSHQLLLTPPSASLSPDVSPTPTSSPTPVSFASPQPTGSTAPGCTFPATGATEAWVCNGQVLGSQSGAPAQVLSNFTWPISLPGGASLGPASLGALAWAPDGRHLAVALNVPMPGAGINCYPLILDPTTQLVRPVRLTQYPTQERAPTTTHLAWADSHTLLVFGAAPVSTGRPVANIAGSAGTLTYRYDLATGTATALPGITTAAAGVVRGSTLFYLELTPLTLLTSSASDYSGTALLHRYDLSKQSEIGAPVTLGQTFTSTHSAGMVLIPGWDATPDASHLAYQQTTISHSASTGQVGITSRFFAANADGTGAIPILTTATLSGAAWLAISPNGADVALIGPGSAATTFTDSLTGGATRSYTPASVGAPAWLPDSSGFDAAISVAGGSDIARYLLSTPGSPASGTDLIQNGSCPAILG